MSFKDLSKEFSDKTGSFSNRIIIIKAGGDLLTETALRALSRQVAYMYKKGAKVAIVHGGAPAIDDELARRKMPIIQDYETGMRLTDYKTLIIADKVLLEKNALFSRVLAEEIGDDKAVQGISGYDHDLVLATKAQGHYSGIATRVNAEKLNEMLNNNIIPVINPICKNEEFEGYKVTGRRKINPNGDDIGARMFVQLGATDLLLCSDMPVKDLEEKPISKLNPKEADKMIADGIITGGMITKVKRAVESVLAHPSGHVYILNGQAPNALKDAVDGKNTIYTTRFTNGAPHNKPVLRYESLKN